MTSFIQVSRHARIITEVVSISAVWPVALKRHVEAAAATSTTTMEAGRNSNANVTTDSNWHLMEKLVKVRKSVCFRCVMCMVSCYYRKTCGPAITVFHILQNLIGTMAKAEKRLRFLHSSLIQHCAISRYQDSDCFIRCRIRSLRSLWLRWIAWHGLSRTPQEKGLRMYS